MNNRDSELFYYNNFFYKLQRHGQQKKKEKGAKWEEGKVGRKKDVKMSCPLRNIENSQCFTIKIIVYSFLKKKTPIFSTDKLMIKIQKNEMPIIPLFYYSEWAVIGWEK